MSIPAVSNLSGLAAAQSMFAASAQAAGSVGSASAAGGNTAAEASIAVLRMALDQERSLVNVLA
jgi:hypothetical protein